MKHECTRRKVGSVRETWVNVAGAVAVAVVVAALLWLVMHVALGW